MLRKTAFSLLYSNIVKYYYNLKELFSILIYFSKNSKYSKCDAKLNCQYHYSSLQCHMIL